MKVGVFYGYAKNPKNILTRQRSDELLSLITESVVYNSFGPRVIMGDFIQGLFDLPQTKLWAQEGFVEIQDWARSRWNYEIQPTCKGKTTKDFVWVSQECLPLIEDVCVDSTWFADHSILYAKFSSLPRPEPIPLWRQPKNIQWKEVDIDDKPDVTDWTPPDVRNASSDDCIQSVMCHLETTIDKTLRSKGKSGLLPNQKGRCMTTDITWGHQHTSPIKASRSGDVKPEYVGEHFQHQLWLRQLRRLQSLVGLLRSEEQTPSKVDHATALWQSIIKAPGFRGGFCRFWRQRATQVPQGVLTLPVMTPTFEVALGIFTAFSVEFRQFEKVLKADQHTSAKQRRKDNPHQIYCDIAKSKPMPVQTLVTTHTVVVQTISQDRKQCAVEPAIVEGIPIHSPFGLVQCKADSCDTLCFDQETSLEIGTVLTQEKWVGSRKEVFAFEELWKQWWGKHSQTTDDAWTPFVDMCDRALPTSADTMPYPNISIQEWDHAVKRKKTRTATGPDGVSREDLMNMPVAGKQSLIDLIAQIEQGKQWPNVCMTALISSLEKVESAATPAAFRPICVMSLIYRVWASIRAKQALQWLIQFAPPELLGSRPKKETANLWFEVALQIEEGQWYNQEVVGVIADITKCFNSLPRVPVWFLGKKLGLPNQLIVPWCQAVTCLQRRFKVDGGVSRSVHATCGLPEGDPLSVVGMFLINLAFSAVITKVHPSLSAWTFVDDWQLVGHDDDELLEGVGTMKQFVSHLTLDLDLRKTYVWGTTYASRKRLKNSGMNLKYHAKNLGGQMCYSKAVTNANIQQRIRASEDFWTWLKRSPAPISQKELSLVVAAWPKMLHGISIVHLGMEHFTKLRTRAMESMGVHGMGTTPSLHLACVCHPRADPGFAAFWQTLKTFRKFCVPSIAFPLLNCIVAFSANVIKPGPCSVLLARLTEVGWSWVGQGILSDHEGLPLRLLDDPIQLVYQRAIHAWRAMVCTQVASREGFQGLEFADVDLTMKKWKHWDVTSQGVLRVALNGTFFTRNKQWVAGHLPDKLCPWCGEMDSIHHRHWECSKFQSSRDEITPSTFRQLDEAPDCLLQHGWIPASPWGQIYRQLLVSLPDLTHEFLEPLHLPSMDLQLFTDGSCEYPDCDSIRRSTWGGLRSRLGK